MTDLTRRDVLTLAGLAIGAACAGAPRRANAAMRGAAAFPSPPLLPLDRSIPGVAIAELSAAWTTTPIAGRTARLRTYNGTFPGPLLRVREGEVLRLRFTNHMAEPTNLHFHGLHIDPSVDNPFLSVDPGQTCTYEFPVPAGSAGTHWYHPHIHGSVAEQLFAGLAGPIVVEGPLEASSRLGRIEDYLLVLKDITLVNGAPAAHTAMDWMIGKEGTLVLVNGAAQPVLAPRGGTVRLRFLNASNARYYRLSLEGHPLYLIATDGGLIRSPQAIDELLLAPGERAEVLVQLTREGSFRLLNLPYNRGMIGIMGRMGAMRGMGGMTFSRTGGAAPTLLTLRAPAARPLRLPSALALIERLNPERAAVTRAVVLSGGMKMKSAGFLINGRSYDHERIDLVGGLGDLQVWEIRNRTGMDHPMHLHTYPFQVLSRNGVPEPFLAWRDVINIAAGGVVRIAIPLRDFAGKTVFHCHIVEHEDRGMMSIVEVT